MPHSRVSSSGFRFSRFRFNDFKFIGFKFRIIVPVSLALLAGCAFVTAQTEPVKTASPSAVVERGKSHGGTTEDVNDTSTWVKTDGAWKCVAHTEAPAQRVSH